MWICPTCKKKFKAKNQWHSCARLNIEDHFRNKEENVREVFEKIVDGLKGIGEFEIIPIKSSIQFRTLSNFLSVRTKKDHIIIEFQLEQEVDDLSIIRSVRISSKRNFYRMVADHPEDISDKIISWFHEAYHLSNI